MGSLTTPKGVESSKNFSTLQEAVKLLHWEDQNQVPQLVELHLELLLLSLQPQFLRSRPHKNQQVSRLQLEAAQPSLKLRYPN